MKQNTKEQLHIIVLGTLFFFTPYFYFINENMELKFLIGLLCICIVSMMFGVVLSAHTSGFMRIQQQKHNNGPIEEKNNG